MSLRKYKNPVNNHFIYNDDIRKSTCKICYFDMAGRHSENLMRHLKRKHPATYAEVMIERQRRRSANPSHQTGSKSTDSRAAAAPAPTAAAAAARATTTHSPAPSTSTSTAGGGGSLSSMFKFDTEPHKLFIKTEKLTFRLDEPGQQQQLPRAETCSNAFDDEHDDGDGDNATTPNGQFESVFLAKTELRDSHLNDSCETITYQDSRGEDNAFIITNLAQQSCSTPANTSSSSGSALPLASNNANSSSVSSLGAATTTAPTPTPTPTPTTTLTAALPANGVALVASCPNPDDAFFLQYLGHKLGKYSATTRHTVQFHINRILYKADMGCYETADASKLSDTDI
ncbi:hypothetical protein KR093_006463 [Drosophila rubida]|uniref:BED-type domain-containing protein n=1 Tax=Drosophila rubida TaxID=30044 RepID=A0AAD4PQ59_9MUSC|nr:hypothetical protein KR093_006463 [Drosophila rubida]